MSKKTPEIRFKGFSEDWEQRKLGEVSDIIGGGTPSTSKKEYWNGDIDWYSPVEIGKDIYVSGSQKKITELGLQKSSAKILPKGTVLFTSRAGIGKTAILAREGTTNQGFQSIVPKPELLDTYFIFSKSNVLKRYGEVNGAGSTFVEVSGKQMAKMPILLPSIEEQAKISSFFKRLDETIALHQRKLDLLKQSRKGFLMKLFPEKGERIPKVRFFDNTKLWKKSLLGDIINTYSAKPYIATAFENGKYEVIQQGHTPVLGFSDVEPFNEYSSVILFGDHTVSIYKPNNSFLLATDGIKILSGKNLDNYFFYYLLDKYRPEPQGYKRHFSILKNQIGYFPNNKEEQQKIGSFFKKIDAKINLQEQILKVLIKTKKSFLKMMFF